MTYFDVLSDFPSSSSCERFFRPEKHFGKFKNSNFNEFHFDLRCTPPPHLDRRTHETLRTWNKFINSRRILCIWKLMQNCMHRHACVHRWGRVMHVECQSVNGIPFLFRSSIWNVNHIERNSLLPPLAGSIALNNWTLFATAGMFNMFYSFPISSAPPPFPM